MYTRWASAEFSQLDVEDLKKGTALIEDELDDAKVALGQFRLTLVYLLEILRSY